MIRTYLLELRSQRNESQQDVANGIGISRQYYSMIENGNRKKRMDITLMLSLANHFGVSASEIIAKEAENPDTNSDFTPERR